MSISRSIFRPFRSRKKGNPDPENVIPDPSPYGEYKYQELPSENHIRLIQFIAFESSSNTVYAYIAHHSLESNPLYIALSYTWGCPVKRTAEEYNCGCDPDPIDDKSWSEASLLHCRLLIIDPDYGHPNQSRAGESESTQLVSIVGQIALGTNLSDYLFRLFNSGDVRHGNTHWIDALCINQKDEKEKASQIPLMGEIYSKAIGVTVWLGNYEKDLETFLWIHRDLRTTVIGKLNSGAVSGTELRLCDPVDATFWRERMGLEPKDNDWKACWRSYMKFFCRYYWFIRAWTMQELYLTPAGKCLFLCGKEQLHGNSILDCQMITGPWTGRLSTLLGVCTYSTGIMMLMLDRDAEFGASEPQSNAVQRSFDKISTCLTVVRPRKSFLDVDKIYSVFGIASRLLPPDYANPFKVTPGATAADVYTWMTALMIERTGSLDMLSAMEDVAERRIQTLPSWVPDYSAMFRKFDYRQGTEFNATLSTEGRFSPPIINGQELRVRGCQIGVISSQMCRKVHLFQLPLIVRKMVSWIGPLYDSKGQDYMDPICKTLMADADLPKAKAKSTTSFNESANKAGKKPDIYVPDYRFFAFSGLIYQVADCITEERKQATAGGQEQFILNSELQARFYTKLSTSLARPMVMFLNPMNGFSETWNFSDFEFYGQPNSQPERTDGALECLQTITNNCAGRWVFTTSNGFIGLGSTSVEVGDEVFLFEGGRFPCILRKLKDRDAYSFMGDAYVHGVMNGELMTSEFEEKFQTVVIV